MKYVSENKYKQLKKLSNDRGIISAVAIDQRGSLKNMIENHSNKETTDVELIKFKKLISQNLTPYSSSILLDPEYGLEGANARTENSGLLLAYEKTGYDSTVPGRLPDLLDEWSVKKLKNEGADAIKFLLYYDVDEDNQINSTKKTFIERIGSECLGEDIPFFLEIVTYDATISDLKGEEYARVKPHKVIESMREFSKEEYNVDVLKVEVPVNMNYVEGFADSNKVVYSKEEALSFYKKQSEVTDLPFIFLSAGVSSELFQETLKFAKNANSDFNGILCGRATWKDGVKEFSVSEKDGDKWLKTHGKDNIEELNKVVEETAQSWESKIISK